MLTICKDNFYMENKVYSYLTEKNMMSNTLSRKDYMFCNNRVIANVKIDDVSAYIELTEFPLLRYFYEFFLKEVEKELIIKTLKKTSGNKQKAARVMGITRRLLYLRLSQYKNCEHST